MTRTITFLLYLICCMGMQRAYAERTDDAAVAPRIDVYSLSASYGEDRAYSIQLGGDWSIGDVSRIRLSGGIADSPTDLADTTTYNGQLGADWGFKPLGFGLAYDYWGDGESVDAHAGIGSLYFHNETSRLGLSFERRRIEIRFDVPVLARALFDETQVVNATGWGVNGSYVFQRINVRAQVKDYRYDTPIGELGTRIDLSRVPPGLLAAVVQRLNERLLRFRSLNASPLTLANSFLDRSISAGMDAIFGDRSLSFDVAHERAASDGLVLNTVTIGWLTPLRSADIEYRVGVSDADGYGTAVFAGISFWFYR